MPSSFSAPNRAKITVPGRRKKNSVEKRPGLLSELRSWISDVGCLFPIWLPFWLWYKLVYVIIPVGLVLWVVGEGELSSQWGPALTLGFGCGGLVLRFYVWAVNLGLNQDEDDEEDQEESGDQQVSPGDVPHDVNVGTDAAGRDDDDPDEITLPGEELPDEAVVESDEPSAVSDESPEPPAEPPSGLDVKSVCDALFVEAEGSMAAARLFEERFDGRPVRWSGTLTRSESYGFDLVFGNQPGTKAVLAVYEADAITYGDTTISAVVQLPVAAVDLLEGRDGQVITVAGRLMKFDGFMRKVYIGEGTLDA